MGIIPKVKCGRCERSFSGLQSKCPYCGARRSKGGKFSMPEAGDPKWRLAVGVLLLVAVLCTVIALVNINRGGEGGGAGENTAEASPSPTDTAGSETSPEASPEASPSPETSDTNETEAEPSPVTPSGTQESIDSIIIKWDYYSGTNEMTIQVGTTIELEAEIYPTTADVGVTWTSENPAICTVDENGNITGVASGKTNIIAEHNGVQGILIVRVKQT